MSKRPFNAKKVKVPLALVEDLCEYLRDGDMHDELTEIIFKAKGPKRLRPGRQFGCVVCGDPCEKGSRACIKHGLGCLLPGQHSRGCKCRERLMRGSR